MNRRLTDLCARRHVAFLALLTPLLVAGCSDDPAGVQNEEEPYAEEIYGFTADANLPYGSAPDANGGTVELVLDLFQPTGGADTARPAVLWLHGGSFQQGHKGEMREFGERFAQRGYVSVSASYRLRPDVDFEYTHMDDPVAQAAKRDAQHDAQAAVRWLRTRAGDLGIDPQRIYVAGFSAGGVAALRVAAHTDDPGESGNPEQSSDVAGVVVIAGHHEGLLSDIALPMLVIHGSADTKVPLETMEQACSAAPDCEFVTVPEAPHNMIRPWADEIIAATSTFLHRLVGPA